jgi:hypothetical protein
VIIRKVPQFDMAIDHLLYSVTEMLFPNKFNQEWENQLSILRVLGMLTPGWDGDRALPPTPETIARAEQLLSQYRASMARAPAGIVSTEDGTIFIEWQSPGFLASLEITGPSSGEWLIDRDDGKPEFIVENWEDDDRAAIDITPTT